MKRRNFLKSASLASAAMMLKGIPVTAASTLESDVLTKMAEAASTCGKILVIIQLNGGNDGLNTVFPLDYWSNLNNARTNILMDESDVLDLDNNLFAGLHPSMPELQTLYNEGKLMIVQGVSYPNPSYSHFRATDIWFTASDSNETLTSGWLGRALDTIYPDFPTGYPTVDMPDPLAIQIGSSLPFSLQGPTMNMGYCVPDPDALLNVINGITDPAPNNDYGHELTFLRLMKDQSNLYRNAIQTAYNVPITSTVTYPTDNYLAEQLRIVARLINGGLKTPIYIVNHPNTHDTHEHQVDSADKTQGSHADNLRILSSAIGAFQTDLEQMGKSQYVTGMTFSEFGRRIISNASYGTDHGAGAPVLFFGTSLNTNPADVASTAYPVPGMIGVSPPIPVTASVFDQVEMQFDFRQIYTTIMQDWLCVPEADATAVLGENFAKLPIWNMTLVSVIDFASAANQSFDIYPNPIAGSQIHVAFQYEIYESLQAHLYSINGSLLLTQTLAVSGKQFTLDASPLLSNGTYILEILLGKEKFHKKVIIQR